MAKITRIKAKDEISSASKEPTKKDLKLVKETKKRVEKANKKKAKQVARKTNKKTFFLFKPFVAFGRYIADSWRELRQVRWPKRKATWQMVLAVFVYTGVFVAFLVLLDILFDLIFNKLLA